MSSNTKTIAFRVSQAVDEQIETLARAEGLSKGEWVRELVMRTLHSTTPADPSQSGQRQSEEPGASNAVPDLDSRLREMEARLRQQIDTVKTAIAEAAKNHHKDLCTMAQVGLTVEESMEQRIDTSCCEVLDAIERLKQSQRSHKDTLLRAIAGDQASQP